MKKNNSIGTRLAKYTILIAIAIGLLFSVANIFLDWRAEKGRYLSTINQLIETTIPLATTAAYELNTYSAERIVQGLAAFGPVSVASITGDKGQTLALVSKDVDRRLLSGLSDWFYSDLRSFEIILSHNNFDRPVGRLTIEINTALLSEGAIRRSFNTFVFGLVRNIVLAVILIFVFQWVLTKPLNRLSRNIQQLDPGTTDPAPVKCPRKHESDELGVLTDAINKRFSERLKYESQLRRAQKMEAIGQLTGGIAHDFNNLLGIILGNLELLKLYEADNPNVNRNADAALKATMRGAALTRKLLNSVRLKKAEEKQVSLNDFIEEMVPLLAKSLTASVTVATHLERDPWPVMLDPGDLEDAILNLSLNARDAMNGSGNLTFETTNTILDEQFVRENPDVVTGEYVMLTITDTGSGMSKEVLEKVFEPFFTTKGEGKGTGLGLAMVYGFVKRSGGHITVDSEIGKGTTIRLYFPHYTEPDEEHHAEDLARELPRGNETILIIDDEVALAEVASIHLMDLGYSTVTAKNGSEALKIIQERDDLDLIFTDIVMPGEIDGYELALQLRKTNPELPVLFTSGFTGYQDKVEEEDNLYLTELLRDLLSKPYDKEELAFAVRHRLDSNNAVTG